MHQIIIFIIFKGIISKKSYKTYLKKGYIGSVWIELIVAKTEN